MTDQIWQLDDGRKISLLKMEDLARVKFGTKLLCIDGTYAVKGQDPIDTDTRSGYLAFGFEVKE